jgi:hypothetical protein
MSEQSLDVIDRAKLAIGKLIGYTLCEPQIRLGRRRHDGTCDLCGDSFGRYAAEKLDFPLDNLDPEESTTIEKIRAMWNVRYVRVCLDCTGEIETERGRSQ